MLPALPALLPPNHILDLVRVVFAFGASAFLSDLLVLRLHGLPWADARLAKSIPQVAPLIFACTSTAVFLVWFALVAPTPPIAGGGMHQGR